jgi:exopolysaccharide biosynthesis polyprenyl glycosylphosphotransferase
MIFSPNKDKHQRLQLQISERRLVLMLGDSLLSILAVFVSLFIWSVVADEIFSWAFVAEQAIWFVVLPVLWLTLASANSFYDLPVAAKRLLSFQKLLMITLQMLVIYLVVFFLSDRTSLPRLFVVYYGVSAFLFVAIWRMLNPVLIGWASTPRHVYIIGTDWTAETIIEVLKSEGASSYQVMGVIGNQQEVGQRIHDVSVVGYAGTLASLIHRDAIKELILTSTRELEGELFQAVMDAYERGIMITPMPIVYEQVTERVPVEHVNQNWAVVLPIVNDNVFNPYPVLKRLQDIVVVGIACIPFVILFPVLALIIKLDSTGTIFFRQTRVGLHGKIFRIYKFRTMISDAEKYTGLSFTQENDPRVTRIGRFLRKTRLDELPQLFNILRGDMSLIGPRPERPEHVERLQQKIPFYRTRHTIPPGLTGWAQVRYKYGANDEDALIKLQYDLYYIRHRSIFLDINILIRTVGKVIGMGGQ